MWATPILLGVIALESFVLIWVFIKYRQDVQIMSWRLDSIWRKVNHWHKKVDLVTGQVHRVTGEHWSIDHGDAEEFDDGAKLKTKKRRRK